MSGKLKSSNSNPISHPFGGYTLFLKEIVMSNRISAVDPAAAQGQAKELLTTVKSKFGTVPNALKTMANSAAALEGYMSLSSALNKGVLPATTREQIALSVSQTNGCEYCLAAHSLTGKLAGLQPDQIVAARRGKGTDPKSQAVLALTQNILERKGKVSDEQLADARVAGLSDAELVEIVGNVAVMTFTNFLNNVAQTNVDFPRVAATV
jgi:uncharacterized peroxidase-related enzyme